MEKLGSCFQILGLDRKGFVVVLMGEVEKLIGNGIQVSVTSVKVDCWI